MMAPKMSKSWSPGAETVTLQKDGAGVIKFRILDGQVLDGLSECDPSNIIKE